jgi:hypothetical protein
MSPSRRSTRQALPPFCALCALIFAGCSADAGGTIDDTGTAPKDAGDAGGGDVIVPDVPDVADTTPTVETGEDSFPSDGDDATTTDGDEAGDDAADSNDASDAGDGSLTCGVATDCPGVDSDCFKRTCVAGRCGAQLTAAGTLAFTQTAGDCKKQVCDGSGNAKFADDDTDVPADDGSQCTAEKCSMGVPLHVPLTIGTACNQSGGTKCDGAGACVTCTAASDCPAGANECQVASCNSGVCSVANVFSGTLVSAQTIGDCKKWICDGNGAIVPKTDDTDVPVDDGKQCTTEKCSMGVPVHAPVAAGTGCSQSGGTQCDASGNCVACLSASDCPAGANECQKATCLAGTCGIANLGAGSVAATQTPGDCKKNLCDGGGKIVPSNDDGDLPADDGKPCTTEACSGGVPLHTPVAVGTTCSAGKCDAAGNCAGCLSATDCPAAPNECQTRACNAGVCGFDKVASGTVTSSQTKGDCRQNQCDGLGSIVSAVDNFDLPTDGIQCTQDLCAMGVPSFPPQPAGTACSQGGTNCDGAGTCLVLPTVTGTTPSDATSALATTTVAITFSTAMNPATLTAQTVAGSCSGNIQVSLDDFASCVALPSVAAMSVGNTVATLTAVPGLLVNRTYKIRVTTGAKSASGGPLATQYTHASGFKTGSLAAVGAGSIVVSQIYGGGGNSGAPYQYDFVELHNRGNTVVSLAGWSVQYASSIGSSWIVTPLAGSIPPGGYYLVQEAGGGSGSLLPTPDATGTISMSATTGKVALVTSTTALTSSTPAAGTYVDLVGWGTSATWFEGSGPAPLTSNTGAIFRATSGCTDTNNNVSDFTTATTPNPRNAATTGVNCGFTVFVQNESDSANEANYCNVQSPPSLGAPAGTPLTVYGQIWEPGLTEAVGAPSSAILAQVGYGPASANPEYEPGWSWTNASWNVQAGNNDEFKATFAAPPTGSYRYVYRFSVDFGATWTLCDLDGAGANPGLTFDLAQEAPMSIP